MKRSKVKYILTLAFLAVLLFFSYQIYVEAKPLQIVYLDVGQGDSILIQKGTQQILIDGGASGKTELAKLGKYLPYFDREIDLVIATHPDRDHIGGLVEVARNYKIGQVLETGAEKDTEVFKEWKAVLLGNKIGIGEVWRGTEIDFDQAHIRIFNPPSKISPAAGDTNNDSIVMRLDYGNNSFLFTGDIEAGAEKELIGSGEDLNVDFLKVAHHGSKYSSSDEFLDAASPEVAIISVGKNNPYGHPHPETLDKLNARNIKILRTDEIGDIEYACNSKCKALKSI